MRGARLGRLVLKNLVRSRMTLFFSSIGVVEGIAIFVFFLSLGYGLEDLFKNKVELPPNEVEVAPEVFATGRIEDARKMILRREDMERVRALPEVVSVYPRLDSTIPATAYLEESLAMARFKRRIPAMELVMDGIPAELVQSDKDFFGRREKFAFHGDDPGKPIPVVIANSLYNIYVLSVAPSLKIPVFPKELFIGFRFNIRLGASPFRGRAPRGEVRERFGEIVGFSNYGNRAGLSVPSEYLDFYNREYGGEDAANRYKSLIVKTTSPEAKLALTATLREMRFRPEVNHEAETIVQIITTITLLLTLIGVVIIVNAGLHIMHTFFMLVRERKAEIGLMRSLGATRADVRVLVVGEAFMLGLLAGAVGVVVGFLGTRLADWAIVALAPTFSQFRGETFFAFPPVILWGAVLFSAVFCALGSMLPARQAARMEPAQALSVQ